MRNRVEEFRDRRKWKQIELAEKVGVSQGTISKIENSKHIPNLDLAYKLEQILDLEIHKLFDDGSQRFFNDESEIDK